MQFSDWQIIRRLLVVCVDDKTVLQTSPALQILRAALPNAAIALLTALNESEVTPLLSWVDDVLTYATNWQDAATEKALIEQLRDRAFDATIIFTSNHSPFALAYLCYLAGIPIRVGQSKEFGGGVLSYSIKPPADDIQLDRHLYLLESIGFPIKEQGNFKTCTDVAGKVSATPSSMRKLRILTWHIHGSYLYYLTQAQHEFYLPVKPGKPEGYGGRLGNIPWADNVYDVPAEDVRNLEFDCILFQSRRNYLQDQYEILSESQRQLPRIYLEHDPPQEHPTNTRHIVDDPNVLLVHVTHFNNLMWDSGKTPTCVIEHGVIVTENVCYTGELARGLVVTNGLRTRGRRLGADVFERVRQSVPLDLVGMDAKSLGGVGEVPHQQLPEFESHYRFFFHPVRYTSLGLAVCEAMMVGMPIIGLATTELVTVVENGVSGYVDTDINQLTKRMQELLADRTLAHRLGEGAKRQAQARFGIKRFICDWDAAFELAISRTSKQRKSQKSKAQTLLNGGNPCTASL